MVHGCQMLAVEMNGSLMEQPFGIVAANCGVRPSDEIWYLKGGLSPFVLRRTEVSGYYRLITPCFINRKATMDLFHTPPEIFESVTLV